MGKIQQYETGDLTIRPGNRSGVVAQGANAAASMFAQAGAIRQAAGNGLEAAGQGLVAAGRSTEALGENLGQTTKQVGKVAADYFGHRNVSELSATGSELLFNLDKEWNARIKNADPNDPAVAETFREEVVKPALEKWRESAWTETGRGFADRHVASVGDHFFKKTASDMSQLAGEAIKLNAHKTVNMLSVMVKDDPTALPTAMDTLSRGLTGMARTSPTIDGVNAAKIEGSMLQAGKEALVKAAAVGIAEKNPDALSAFTSDPKVAQYISGQDVKQIESYARTQIRAARAEERYEQMMAEKAREQASEKVEEQLLKQVYSGEKLTLTPREIASNDTLTRTAKMRMIQVVERELKPEALSKVSQATTVDLLAGIRDQTVTDLNPVYDAYQRGELNKSDFAFLRQEFAALRTPGGEALNKRKGDFFEGVKALIDKSNPLMGNIDQTGKLNFYQFQIDVERQMTQLRKEGKDPWTVFDPASPNYAARPERLAPFQKSLQQSATEMARRPSATPEADAKPPAGYPSDARKFPDGNWYVYVDGKRKMIVPKAQ